MHSQFALDFYISFVLTLALAFGIAFETPIVVFFLSWTKLVPTAKMAAGRRYVLLAVVVTAAILTPPDVISQLLLAGPMYLLFELGLVIARIIERRPSPQA
jgi:sec-independent protein translocase protein TatC